jgi:hypothetical protein
MVCTSQVPDELLPEPLRVDREVSDMLQPYDLVPHFEVTDLRGERVRYSSIWQRKNLVLVTLPDPDPSSRDYAGRLMARVRGPNEDDTAWIVTRDRVAGLPHPGVVVADRWGEVVHVAHALQAQDLPGPDEIAGWVRYVQHRCPECEGEAK